MFVPRNGFSFTAGARAPGSFLSLRHSTSRSGLFHILFVADAVMQNFVMQNCIGSLFCPLFHNLFFAEAVKQ